MRVLVVGVCVRRYPPVVLTVAVVKQTAARRRIGEAAQRADGLSVRRTAVVVVADVVAAGS